MAIRDNLGGGSSGAVLDTLEEISANTESGKAAGALAVKELNNSLDKVKTYVGSDGKLHFVDASGADTALPFNPAKCSEAIIDKTETSSRVNWVIKSTNVSNKTGSGTFSGEKISSTMGTDNKVKYTCLKNGLFLICDTVGGITLKNCTTGAEIYSFTRGSSIRVTFVGFMG